MQRCTLGAQCNDTMRKRDRCGIGRKGCPVGLKCCLRSWASLRKLLRRVYVRRRTPPVGPGRYVARPPRSWQKWLHRLVPDADRRVEAAYRPPQSLRKGPKIVATRQFLASDADCRPGAAYRPPWSSQTWLPLASFRPRTPTIGPRPQVALVCRLRPCEGQPAHGCENFHKRQSEQNWVCS